MLRHHRHHHHPGVGVPAHFKYSELGLGHYDDVEHLIAELEQEKRHRDAIDWSNAEMERQVTELETFYKELQEDQKDGDDDNEWKVRFESQTELNKQLEEQRGWLELELTEVRRKLTTGSYPEANKFNLDALNETELLRLVKHLERSRNGLYSSLRDLEWKLDKESKEFRHFDEIRRTCRSELKEVNHGLERLQAWSRIEPSNPLYSTSLGYYGHHHWLDTPPPLYMKGSKGMMGYGGIAGAKSRKEEEEILRRDEEWLRSLAVSRGGGKFDGPHSPAHRTKSRAEKKAKKKENPAPVDDSTKRRGGTQRPENVTFEGGDRKEESNPSSGADTYIKEESDTKPKRRSSQSQDRSPTE